MTRLRFILPRTTFLLAGIALAALIASGFMWYGAGHASKPPFQPSRHRVCDQPVPLRAEDYNRWGSTREEGLELAQLDFCDPVRVEWRDGRQEVWFWFEIKVTGQVFPYAGWGYPWNDVETPFPADNREPRNPWWTPRNGLHIRANQIGYTGGDGAVCPLNETLKRGLNLFFYRDEGFQLPVGTTYAGWVCVYFDGWNSLPDAFTLTVLPERARIVQWVDKLFVLGHPENYDEPELSTISEDTFCAYARATHPDSIQAGGACDG
jgi:hypothetical protein